MLTRRLLVLAALLAAFAAGTIPTESLAQTPDKLKVAISQRGFWDSSFLEFAQKEGFLKEANLDVEFFYTEGGGQTLQVVTSGRVDIAMSNSGSTSFGVIADVMNLYCSASLSVMSRPRISPTCSADCG